MSQARRRFVVLDRDGTINEERHYLRDPDALALLPGDVISPGTPEGVGAARGIFLKPGNRLDARIGSIGTLTNPVV